MPRVQCEWHKVKPVAAPWSEFGSRFSDAVRGDGTIEWLREATTAAVAQQMRAELGRGGRNQAALRAARVVVAARCRCRIEAASSRLAFQKRHEYDDGDQRSEHSCDARGRRACGKESLEEFYKQFDGEQLACIETVAMDMWEPYIRVQAPSTCRRRRRRSRSTSGTWPDILRTPLTGCGAPSIAGWPPRMISG